MERSEARRIIYSLEIDREPLPGHPPGTNAVAVIVLTLTRAGMSKSRIGQPPQPQRRTFDLRVGDFVMVNPRWRKEVLGVKTYRDGWRTDEPPDEGDGYVVR